MEEKTAGVSITRVNNGKPEAVNDRVAIEAPLGISLEFEGSTRRDVSITMRTPGHDEDLAVGFLFTEGIIHSPKDVAAVTSEKNAGDRVVVTLAPGVQPVLGTLDRNFYTTSSCGVCGKSSLEAVALACDPVRSSITVDQQVLLTLPDRLREVQQAFGETGGLHAAGLFSAAGKLIRVREDVGRHNAVDKLIGSVMMRDQDVLPNAILMLSGRISFELVQKAAMAGIPVIAAVGAPSSLAIELAQSKGICLAGFVRGNRFNVYTFAGRIRIA
ncbi:MAG: formate dehydrogenase accessory sulfurtransferase FdhD [Bacteroidota bacterium]